MRKHLLLLYAMLFIETAAVSLFAQDKVQHEYVDLGLSVKWATCNVGADKPEDFGDYYAWGELVPKESYTWANYRFRTSGNDEALVKFSKYTSMYYTSVYDADKRDYIADNKTRLDLEDDVAHVKWGGNWRLPTDDEMNELVDSCTWTWTTLNGVNGCLVTSNRSGYTDRSIFLPADKPRAPCSPAGRWERRGCRCQRSTDPRSRSTSHPWEIPKTWAA